MMAWNGHLSKHPLFLCPSHALDPLGHHALTCKSGGDLIVRHNALRETFWESCKLACIGGQLEAGSNLDEVGRQTRPADILVQNWEFGKLQHWISPSHHIAKSHYFK